MTKLHKNICLIHGWGADTSKLQPLKEELEKLSWKVFLPKLPFFELAEPKTPWTLKDFANFIDTGSRKFFKNEPYCLFGYSFGGRIAIKMSSENFPKINSVVLCSAAGISRGNAFKRFFFKILIIVFYPFKKLSESKFSFFKKIIYRLAGASDYEQIKTEIKKKTFRNIIEENLKSQAAKIKIPTLILWGEKDKSTPIKDAYFLKQKITNSNLKVFPEENHQLSYHQPQNIALKIDRWFETL